MKEYDKLFFIYENCMIGIFVNPGIYHIKALIEVV